MTHVDSRARPFELAGTSVMCSSPYMFPKQGHALAQHFSLSIASRRSVRSGCVMMGKTYRTWVHPELEPEF